MKPNPFHVLGLPVTASDQEVAERFQELAMTGEREAGALAEWAKDELLGLPERRELHVLLQAPGADYRGEAWEDFARQYGRRPAPFDAGPGGRAPAAGAEHFDLAALARGLLDGMLVPPEVDVRAAAACAPVPLRPGPPPLEVRDVLFG